MSDLTEFPTLGLTDYLAEDLATVYQVTENRLLLRINVYWLIEIQVKKLHAFYQPEKFQKSKGSHKVVGSVYTYKNEIPDLNDFITRLEFDDTYKGRLPAIQNFDYVSARYSSALEVFRADLPLVEDLFELYWILSNHLRQIGFI